MTVARSSCSATRTMATRSNSPATEYTSDTPGISAMAWAASGISSISHWIRATAWTVIRSGPFEHDREALPAGDAQGGEAERRTSFAHLVGERQQDASPAHPDRMAQRDAAAQEVEPVPVELELALTRDHLG